MVEVGQEKSYQYSPLHRSGSFRVLELTPDSADAPLKGKLVEVHKADDPSFIALSYTWGAPVFPKQIVEEEQDAVLHITENLFDALQALRNVDSTQHLWIDALCINQQDNAEKSVQVAQMDTIYKGAERVIVWLGKEDCSKGFNELQRIGQDCELYGFSKIFPFPQAIPDQSAFQKFLELSETCDVPAVEDIFERTWFERVWVVQEFVLAKEITIQCGTFSISYDLFSKAVCALMQLLKRPSLRNVSLAGKMKTLLTRDTFLHAWKLIQTRERYLALHAPQRSNPGNRSAGEELTDHINSGEKIRSSTLVEYCLDVARSLKCADNRDRVYGMLGFANTALSIIPNYDLTPEEVWTDLALKSLLAGDMSILHYAGLTYRPNPKVSSFVADISNPNYYSPRFGGFATPVFHAGTKSKANVELMQGTVMLDALPEIKLPMNHYLPKLKIQLVDKSVHQGYLSPAIAFTPGEVESEVGDIVSALQSLQLIPFLANHQRLNEVWTTVRSWVASRAQYEEGFDKAFARTMVADYAIPTTQAALGESGNDKLGMLLFFLSVCIRKFPQFEDRLFVPDKFIERAFGEPVSFGFAMFEGDEPVVYNFPTSTPAAILCKEFGVILTESGETIDCDFPTEDFMDKDDERELQTFVEITEPLKGRLKVYKEAMATLHADRCYFTTTRGLIGLGPKHMEAGDLIVVIEGAETPFVLKKTGIIMPKDVDDVDKLLALCTVKGECYLHGWMQGEAMDEKYASMFQEVVLA